MESVEQLAKKAIDLQPHERLQLVEAILFSLDNPDKKIEEAWAVEAESRYQAYKRGEIKSVDWEEIKKIFEH